MAAAFAGPAQPGTHLAAAAAASAIFDRLISWVMGCASVAAAAAAAAGRVMSRLAASRSSIDQAKQATIAACLDECVALLWLSYASAGHVSHGMLSSRAFSVLHIVLSSMLCLHLVFLLTTTNT
jgi:hypothetical protein